MALTLLAPTGAVTEMPLTVPGPTIIAVRLADYVGPVRGTLSVVADALSVGGDVVLDTQTIPVQTTNAGIATQFADPGLGDSVRVPLVDLPLDPDISYVVYASSRQEGDPPSNARSRTTWLTYGNDSAPGTAGFWAWGVETGSGSGYRGNPFRTIARPVVPNYIIYECGLWTRVTETYLKLRAWGIAGGSQSTRFDMLYLVPIQESFGSTGDWTSEDFLLSRFGLETPLRYGTNGTLLQDNDNDATSVPWLGLKFSAMRLGAPWTPENTGIADYQEDDDESTAVDVNSFEWDFVDDDPWDIVDPKSSLAYIAGTTHVSAGNIVGEVFPSFVRRKPSTPSVGNWSFGTAGSWGYNSSDGWVVGGEHASSTIDGGETFFPHYWVPGGTDEGLSVIRYYTDLNEPVETRHRVTWGQVDRNTSTFFAESLTDPRQHHMTIRFRSAIAAAKASFSVVQDAMFGVGTVKITAGSYVWAELRLDGSGDLTLALIAEKSVTSSDDVTIASPVSVGSGYSAGQQWWVKIEQRLYHFRAKAWEDGDTEPDWQVEGIEPLWYTTTDEVLYPWDDNWLGDPTHDSVVSDPLDTVDTTSRWYIPFVQAGVGASLPAMQIDLHAMEVDHDPGSGTLGDVSTKTTKYDGSAVLDGPVDVPYGSHHWVYEPDEKNRHFFAEGGGPATFDIRVWKNAGFPPLTPAIVGHVWERRSHQLARLLSLSHLRVGNRYGDRVTVR